MDRDEVLRRGPRPARSLLGGAPPARSGPSAARSPPPPPRRALRAASARPGLRAQRSPGEGRRVPPPGPGAQTGESTRRARSPLPASLAARASGSPCPSPGQGAPREYPPLKGLSGVSAGPGSEFNTQASPGSPRAARPPSPVPAGSPWRRLPPAAPILGARPCPQGYSPELHVENAKAEKHVENPLAKVSVHDPGRGAAP